MECNSFEEHPACKVARQFIAERANVLRVRLQRWVSINSGSYNQEGLERMAEAIIYTTSFLGFSPEVLQDEASETACAIRWRKEIPGCPSILLNGHLDTVFGLDHSFQSYEVIDDSRIQGPGITDMKGGLVIMFAALQAFLESNLSDKLGWEVLVTFDEEIGSFKGLPYLAEAARNNDLGLVFESSIPDGKLVRNRKGTGKVVVEVRGKASHAGRDFAAGRNAIAAAGAFVDRAHRLNKSIPGSIVNAGHIEGGGPINVVPDFSRIEFNVRADTREIQAKVMKALHSLAENVGESSECSLSVTGGFTRPAKVADDSTKKLFNALCQTAQAIGYDLDWRDTGGASDGNLLQAEGLTNIDNLGAIGHNIHSSTEYILIDSLVSRAQLVASFLINLAGGKLDQGELTFWDVLNQAGQ